VQIIIIKFSKGHTHKLIVNCNVLVNIKYHIIIIINELVFQCNTHTYIICIRSLKRRERERERENKNKVKLAKVIIKNYNSYFFLFSSFLSPSTGDHRELHSNWLRKMKKKIRNK
jgi:hypothetical protein